MLLVHGREKVLPRCHVLGFKRDSQKVARKAKCFLFYNDSEIFVSASISGSYSLETNSWYLTKLFTI